MNSLGLEKLNEKKPWQNEIEPMTFLLWRSVKMCPKKAKIQNTKTQTLHPGQVLGMDSTVLASSSHRQGQVYQSVHL